jgi:lipoprotein NlpI
MKKTLWIWGATFAAALACGSAGAQDGFLTAQFGGMDMPRIVPPPKSKQSPAANACATGGGRIELAARIAACTNLIDSGKWKGKDIGWAYANRCAVYSAQGRDDKALGDCVQAILLDPDSVIPYQIRGDIALKRGESDKALADYDSAIQHGARYAAIFVDRGNLLLAKGESEKALADFNQALKINPNSARALVARGAARFTGGDFAPAIADFDKAIELTPDNSLAWFNRGSAFFAKGDAAKAAENFKQALTLSPANAYASLWLFIASGNANANAKSELQAHAARLSQKSWPWPVVQFYLGAKDGAQTIAAASNAGEQCEAQFYVGEERAMNQAANEALPYLRKAVEICPKDFGEMIQAKSELKKWEAAPPKPEEPAAKPEPTDRKNVPAEPAPDLKK